MTEAGLEAEPFIRLGFFIVMLVAVGTCEALAPRRRRALARLKRWPGNLGIAVLNTLVIRVIFPTAAVGVALLTETNGWGLLNAFVIPTWIAVPVSVVVLDLAIYLQHVLFHAVPLLWRLHRMHHADLDFDVTTGVRFHPIEIMLSMCIKLMIVVTLGASALAVLIFEVLLNATSLFNHGNVRIPLPLDRFLRWLVVTPDMHRVHHSWHPNETNSNFGFNLPWWDRLLGTYQDQPREGHESMTIGINLFREPAWERLDRMLIQPFVGPANSYPINSREALEQIPDAEALAKSRKERN
ncbi:sterol desaturase family protein [Nitrosovibrio tenuis]|uniref:Sterol desaturase/sphingolipid hydroxylase, fatty acid hydroxylase superfamily n=1 Tax=Nitrosovibrio tenuis TaxID=1233 RepID=A0A1H7J2T7_9PROT|nr:sterol desaturase family protein [Nitrosovibrio tenuis]SEK68280.1 Sterol desaturase/sphingolipid hydroxylase, fatty acid hydroxylase superfamily [Nitrosovibrio tenuis]